MHTLHYTQQGKGPVTLVLLHGFCENESVFSMMRASLPSELHVLSIDIPGFGKSERIPQWKMPQMADVIAAWIQQHSSNPCFIMGHSMGGYISLEILSRYPELVKGIGLIHSTTTADSEERIAIRKKVIQFIQEHGKEAYIQDFIPGLFFDKTHSAKAIELAIAAGLSSSESGIIDGIEAMMHRQDHTHTLTNYSGPVFLGIGKQDAIIPEKVGFTLASSCQQSHIAYLTQSAHNGMLEEPEKLANEIAQFCLAQITHSDSV